MNSIINLDNNKNLIKKFTYLDDLSINFCPFETKERINSRLKKRNTLIII